MVNKKPIFYQASGRRKTATSRVRLYPVLKDKEIVLADKKFKAGDIIVNDRPVEVYFPGDVNKKAYLEPFRITNTVLRFAASIKVEGSGKSGQLGAVIHGISRVLSSIDADKFKPILRKHGFLTRDPRAKERRKPGLAGKARKEKQSPKR